MKITKSEIYNCFKKSLDELKVRTNENESILGNKLNAATEASIQHIFNALQNDNMAEIVKEYAVLKSNVKNIDVVTILYNAIESMFTTMVVSLISATLIITSKFLDIIKEIYIERIKALNGFIQINSSKFYTALWAIIIIITILTAIKALIEAKPTPIENYNKKIFNTVYRDKYIDMLSQIIVAHDEFKNMNYSVFENGQKTTICKIKFKTTKY